MWRKRREWDGWMQVYWVMRKTQTSDSPLGDIVITEHRCRLVAVMLCRLLNRWAWEPCHYVAYGMVKREEQGG